MARLGDAVTAGATPARTPAQPAAPHADLARLFSPRSIAIVGASDDAKRPGGQPVVALTQWGYRGAIHLVNPNRAHIRDRACLAEVSALPDDVDMALVAVPATQVPGVLRQCGERAIPFAIVLSAGFREVGAGALEEQLRAAIAASGVRVLGPNCTGLLNLRNRVFAGFGAGFRNRDLAGGPIAMVSQSGGYGYSVVAFLQAHGLGLDYFVASGNETDIDSTELLGHLVEQPDVRVVVSYLEGVTNGERLRAVGMRALELGKPILVWKAGNSAPGREAAASHTANLTSAYDFYVETFRTGGFVEVREMYDLVDCTRAFLPRRLPRGRSVALLTTSGGAGVVLADECAARGLTLPGPARGTLDALQALVPGFASLANPIDLSAALAQQPAAFNTATHAVAMDEGMDQVILRSFPGGARDAWARGLVEIAAATDKPLLVSISGLRSDLAAVLPMLDQAGITCYDTPARTVTAAAALADFADKLRCAPRGPPAARAHPFRPLPLPADRRTLSEHEAAQCLAAYGIDVARSERYTLAEIDALEHCPLQFPVAVKIDSASIAHKTEAGGVRLGIPDLKALRAAAHHVVASASRYVPGTAIEAVLVQEMVAGVEVLAGALVDRCFGPVVVLGAGGVLAEVAAGRALAFAPIDEAGAHALIERTRVARLLHGHRGTPAGDTSALATALARLSWLIADHRETIAEIDVNPLFVRARGLGAIAADALIALQPGGALEPGTTRSCAAEGR